MIHLNEKRLQMNLVDSYSRPFQIFLSFLLFSFGCSGQDKISTKTFPDIALVNKIEFFNPKYDQARFSCAFLLSYKEKTYAVTAKHLLKFIKPAEMKSLSFANTVKSWSMFPLLKKDEVVQTDKLLNENPAELLESKAAAENDWLLFSIKQNNASVKPLTIRTTALLPGEKLYVIGWTRKMEDGPQRVYEFEYIKTVGNRLLLKDIMVPEQFGGLSGGPVVDAQGLAVGIVSGGTEDPVTGKKYFSPCNLTGIVYFLENYRPE